MQSAAGSPLGVRARRRARSKTLQDFQLRTQEKFLYTCGAIDLWEWEVRLLDSEQGADGDELPICLGGRGAAPAPNSTMARGRRVSASQAKTSPIHNDAKWTGSANRKAYSIFNALDGRNRRGHQLPYSTSG